MRSLRVSLVLLAAGLASSACGRTEALPSDLPRTTESGITITMTETEELLPLPGCHTYWSSRQEEAPPGACEQVMTVRRFIAQHGSVSVETSVVGDVHVDPLYAMGLLSRQQTDAISIVVVAPPPDAATIRLVDSTGGALDVTKPVGPLVVLAGLDGRVDVEALSADGIVIAACPQDGVTIDDVTYACTVASGAEVPVTTTPLSESGTP